MGSRRYDQNDLANFDWDDGPLIAAYDKAKARAEAQIKKLEKKKSSNQQSSSEDKQWTAGSFCRAIYSEDGFYYEAKILEVEDGRCLVEFLGYGDTEEVKVDDLKPSKGKKARKSQIKSAKETSKMSLTCGDTSDAESVSVASSAAKEKCNIPCFGEDVPEQDVFAVKTNFPTFYRQRPLPAYTMAPPPLPPPVGHCPNIANDPELSALLRSWYMAGYYLGRYEQQTQRGTRYSAAPCCCGHSNNCC